MTTRRLASEDLRKARRMLFVLAWLLAFTGLAHFADAVRRDQVDTALVLSMIVIAANVLRGAVITSRLHDVLTAGERR